VRRNLRSGDTGSAAVEAALALPMLVAVLIGAIDFGRVFFAADAVTQAVHAGVQYGATQTSKTAYTDPTSAAATTNYSLMQTRATNAAADIAGFAPTASSFCTCSNVPDTAIACTTACGSGNTLRFYVRVVGTKAFTTVAPYPGVPRNLTITRTAVMQVVR
jgi:Flp pilus assembly protein TadG